MGFIMLQQFCGQIYDTCNAIYHDERFTGFALVRGGAAG